MNDLEFIAMILLVISPVVAIANGEGKDKVYIGLTSAGLYVSFYVLYLFITLPFR